MSRKKRIHPSVSTTLSNGLLTRVSVGLNLAQSSHRPSKLPVFCVNSQGLVVQGSQIVVPNYCDYLKRDFMKIFNDTPSAGHYGIAKTCKEIHKLFFLTSTIEDVTRFVAICVSCARKKARRHVPSGKLQTILVPGSLGIVCLCTWLSSHQ
jgi:hypothetical protein